MHITPTAFKKKRETNLAVNHAEPPIYQNIKTPITFGAGFGYLGICVLVNDIKRVRSIREQRNQKAENNPPREKDR